LLYPIVREYWPEFQAELASQDKYLPAYVIKEFDENLKCGRLEHGFLRVRCESCHDEKLVAFSCKKRGFCPSCGCASLGSSLAPLVAKASRNRATISGLTGNNTMKSYLPNA
jgi:ribosomal protein S27E